MLLQKQMVMSLVPGTCSAAIDFAPVVAEGFSSVVRQLFVGLPTSSQLYLILAGVGLPAQLRIALIVLLGQLGLGLSFPSFGCIKTLR